MASKYGYCLSHYMAIPSLCIASLMKKLQLDNKLPMQLSGSISFVFINISNLCTDQSLQIFIYNIRSKSFTVNSQLHNVMFAFVYIRLGVNQYNFVSC